MILDVNKNGLDAVSEKIKSGFIFRLNVTPEKLIHTAFYESTKSKPEYNQMAVDFKSGMENFFNTYADTSLNKQKEISSEGFVDGFDGLIKNKNFTLQIGPRLTHVFSIDDKIFNTFYFNISNEQLSTEVSSQNLIDGLKTLAQISVEKYDGKNDNEAS